MYIYNTLTGQKEKFIPINESKVSIYACGPTVYNYIHIGNARPMCVFDVLRRYLEHTGYKVNFVQNFTDIDDKIIKKALEERESYKAISEKYIKEYKIDAKGLNIKEATLNPRATENIGKILDMISDLIKKGFAYVLESGDVYFRMKSFKEYGKLSHQSTDELRSGARVSVDALKEDPLDFALWKSAKEGEPFWESPWGKGRPGWHIECSAMAMGYLGKTIDIHCGGQDLIFPHHENEIAQSECCSGVKFANYWMHNGYINVDSKKMSKSLGNFFTVRDVAREYGYESIRYLMISSHYRSPISYSKDVMEQCKASLKRLYNFRESVEFLLKSLEDEEKGKKSEETENLKGNYEFSVEKFKIKFYNAMDDDLNTADALAAIFEMAKYVNTIISRGEKIPSQALKDVLNLFEDFTGILGILKDRSGIKSINSGNENDAENAQIEELIKMREVARKNKDWKDADRIRDLLKSKNVILEDTPNGVKWKISRG